MKTSELILILFLFLGGLYIFGTIEDLFYICLFATIFLVPSLLLYYRYKAKKLMLPLVGVILLFYVRDFLLIRGFWEFPIPIMALFLVGIVILFMCSITNWQKSKIHPIEKVSLLIMYSFLIFLFFSIGETIPRSVPSYKAMAFIYLFSLVSLLAVTFTAYIFKSHKASIWLMIAAASLLLSELSLFFKMYIIADFSVNLFYPLFHVFFFYAVVQHAINRKKVTKLRYF